MVWVATKRWLLGAYGARWWGVEVSVWGVVWSGGFDVLTHHFHPYPVQAVSIRLSWQRWCRQGAGLTKCANTSLKLAISSSLSLTGLALCGDFVDGYDTSSLAMILCDICCCLVHEAQAGHQDSTRHDPDLARGRSDCTYNISLDLWFWRSHFVYQL